MDLSEVSAKTEDIHILSYAVAESQERWDIEEVNPEDSLWLKENLSFAWFSPHWFQNPEKGSSLTQSLLV